MLTKKMLEMLEPSTIFATGYAFTPEGVQDVIKGTFMKWVAVRGGIWDWAVYAGETYHDEQNIADYGTKLYGSEVKELILADEEAWNLYRR